MLPPHVIYSLWCSIHAYLRSGRDEIERSVFKPFLPDYQIPASLESRHSQTNACQTEITNDSAITDETTLVLPPRPTDASNQRYLIEKHHISRQFLSVKSNRGIRPCPLSLRERWKTVEGIFVRRRVHRERRGGDERKRLGHDGALKGIILLRRWLTIDEIFFSCLLFLFQLLFRFFPTRSNRQTPSFVSRRGDSAPGAGEFRARAAHRRLTSAVGR